jgi:glucose-6-phosphate 1-dehydrogenase
MFEKLNLPKSGIFVIYGATGDLTHRKLMPALLQLLKKDYLPKCFHIVAVARRDKTHKEYRNDVNESLKKFTKANQTLIQKFLKKIYYFKTDFDKSTGYLELKEFLNQIDKDNCAHSNRIFYMATLTNHFSPIIENMKKYNFVERTKEIQYRVVIEKPFGVDLESATKLNKTISKIFKEDEIFRIDHYLGKEAVQNLFALRFANRIYEPIWNNKHIENIQIVAAESIGVGTRAGYYDKSGALQDMVQNHLMQVLSLITMEPPIDFSTKNIKDEKVKLLKSIKKFSRDEIKENVIIGQYEGYLNEDRINKQSLTETYVALKMQINNKRWVGVPFYLRTGKYLKKKATEVVIYFKDDDNNVFTKLKNYKQNVLVIRLQPDEGIFLRFNTKKSGNKFDIERVFMDYSHKYDEIDRPEAYEKLIYNALLDDSTLFTRWDEVKEAWSIIDPIELYYNDEKPIIYKKGTWGPIESSKLLEKEGHHWRLRADKQ